MKKTTLLTMSLLISLTIQAGTGTVTVLEAPIFSSPSKNAKVIQYKRKGDSLYINQESFREDDFSEHLQATREQLESTHETYQKDYPDPLFEGKFRRLYKNFYQTVTRSGRQGYILKDHVFLNYNDKRELTQTVIQNDPTDYRIAEPLPENYPIQGITGYKGQIIVSLGTPTDQPYPYSQPIKDTGFDFNKEFTFVWAKQVSYDVSKRFFFGGEFNIMSGQSKYISTNIDATESQIRIGIGPYLTYDLFRQERHTINIQGSLVFHFYDSKEITQDFNLNNQSGSVTFRSMYFSPKIGLSHIYSDAIGTLDLITGVKATFHSPHTYTAETNPDLNTWVKEYKVGYSLEQSYFLGIQTAY